MRAALQKAGPQKQVMKVATLPQLRMGQEVSGMMWMGKILSLDLQGAVLLATQQRLTVKMLGGKRKAPLLRLRQGVD